MNNKDLNIYIAMHKPCDFINQKFYCPIQVNGGKNEKFLSVTDATGDNISYKNARYCELTALYWIWKNDIHSKYIGLCHYRRYFKMNFGILDLWKKQYNCIKINEEDIKVTPRIIHYLEKGYTILPKPLNLGKVTVKKQYDTCHVPEDLKILESVLKKTFPNYSKAWDNVFECHKLYPYNMFIMNRKLFNKYMDWLFQILFEVEKLIPPKSDPYQNRTFGFMSERLFNVFLTYHKAKIKELPIIFIE